MQVLRRPVETTPGKSGSRRRMPQTALVTHFGSGVCVATADDQYVSLYSMTSSSVGSKPVGMVRTACVPARTCLTNCPGAILLLVDPIFRYSKLFTPRLLRRNRPRIAIDAIVPSAGIAVAMNISRACQQCASSTPPRRGPAIAPTRPEPNAQPAPVERIIGG
jgi:hypothetical protein